MIINDIYLAWWRKCSRALETSFSASSLFLLLVLAHSWLFVCGGVLFFCRYPKLFMENTEVLLHMKQNVQINVIVTIVLFKSAEIGFIVLVLDSSILIFSSPQYCWSTWLFVHFCLFIYFFFHPSPGKNNTDMKQNSRGLSSFSQKVNLCSSFCIRYPKRASFCSSSRLPAKPLLTESSLGFLSSTVTICSSHFLSLPFVGPHGFLLVSSSHFSTDIQSSGKSHCSPFEKETNQPKVGVFPSQKDLFCLSSTSV